MPNFQKNCQNRHLKILNDSCREMYYNDTIHKQFCWVLQKLLAFKDHFRAILVTTTAQLSNEKKTRGARVPQAISTCKSAISKIL